MVHARNATVLAATSLIVATQGIAAPPGQTGVPLRIVTLNLRDGVGAPGSGRFNDFGDYITVLDQDGAGPNHGLAPDIVCFQEVESAAAWATPTATASSNSPTSRVSSATG